MKPELDLIWRFALFCLLLLTLGREGLGQTHGLDLDSEKLLNLPKVQQIAFVNSVLERGFPTVDGDKFSLLLVNRSEIVVPQLVIRIESEVRRSNPSERLIDLASVMISYAGDLEALRGVGRLIVLNEKRFGPLIERTLDSAIGWRNPFTVAYAGLMIGDEAISKRIVAWSEKASSSERMRRLWAGALAEKYGRVPDRADWKIDPLASRLTESQAESIRSAIVAYAEEAKPKR